MTSDKTTPRPWRIDRKYPAWPAIIGADDSVVNIDFENNGNAELIVEAVNAHDAGLKIAAEHLRAAMDDIERLEPESVERLRTADVRRLAAELEAMARGE